MAHFGIVRSYVPICAAMLLILHVGISFGTDHKSNAPQSKPFLVVFNFESNWDDGTLGRRVAEMFRGHAKRRRLFTQLDPISFDEALTSSGVEVRMGTSPVDVAKAITTSFSADVAIWGMIERAEEEDYFLHVKVVDQRENSTSFALNRSYTSTLHGLQTSVDAALDDFLGKLPSNTTDTLDDKAWRTRFNLCKNGNFEHGTNTPEAWEPIDCLGTFWVKDVSPTGRCIMMDTNILDSQYREWRSAFEAGSPASNAPKKLRTRAPYYDTIGGNAGVHLYSDYIAIKQGKAYRLDLDARGPCGISKCFIKGYATFRTSSGKADLREVYRAQINIGMRTEDPTDWEHYTMIFHPTQPLLLLKIRSEFDGGKMGRSFQTILANRLATESLIETKDLAKIAERISEQEHLIQIDASKHDISHVVTSCLGRGFAVWGEIIQKDDALQVRIRSLDVRPGGTATKDWPKPKTWDTSERLFPKTAAHIASELMKNANIVTQLRVKLDTYWPVGNYYFDNIKITEEPASPD